jgi:F-type H+-transporting ATPase subunit gamma
MELVAVSKMKRAQQAAVRGGDYARLLAGMLLDLEPHAAELEHPFLSQREIKTRGILLLTTDKGLCGPLNTNLFKLVEAVATPAKFVCIGNKGAQFLARTGRDLHASFTISDRVAFRETQPVSQLLSKLYLDGAIDTIEVVFPHFKNTLAQIPVTMPLLPLDNLRAFMEKARERAGAAADADKPPPPDARPLNFEPAPSAILGALLPFYINQEIHQTILAARASEHSARMVAMKTANDNAGELLDRLTLMYNKARQNAITNEILELAAGAAGT